MDFYRAKESVGPGAGGSARWRLLNASASRGFVQCRGLSVYGNRPRGPERRSPGDTRYRVDGSTVARAFTTGTLALLAAVLWPLNADAAGPDSEGADRRPDAPSGAVSADRRPDILLICIDTLRPDHLASYGGAEDTGRYLAALARDGVVFERAYSTASWTRPSVPSLLTGTLPNEHGVLSVRDDSFDVLSDSVPTLAEELQRSGYRTAAFVENEHLRARYSGLNRGFDRYVEHAGNPAEIALRFQHWLDSETDARPYFAYLHFLDPHLPYTPWKPLKWRSDAAASQRFTWHSGMFGPHWWILRERVRYGNVTLTSGENRALQELYDAEIRIVDSAVGAVVASLRAHGRWPNTAVVVTADHGEGFLEHDRLDHGYGPHEELLRVPMILRFPVRPGSAGSGSPTTAAGGGERATRRPAGLRSRAGVSLRDVAPTLLRVAGASAPAGMTGEPLQEVLSAQPEEAFGRPVFSYEVHGAETAASVTAGDWRYVRMERSKPTTGMANVPVPKGLQPGMRVQVEGALTSAGFVGAHVRRIDSADTDLELEGPLLSVGSAERTAEVLGVSFGLPRDGRILDPGREQAGLAALKPGVQVRVHLPDTAPGESVLPLASKVEIVEPVARPALEVEGVISGIHPAANGDTALDLVLAGDALAVRVDPGAEWHGIAGEPGVRRVRRMAAGRFGEGESLFFLPEDPLGIRDVASQNPERAGFLRGLLESAVRSPDSSGRSGSGHLEHETRQWLESMGYLE